MGSARHLPIDKMDAEAGQWEGLIPTPTLPNLRSTPPPPLHSVFLTIGILLRSAFSLSIDKMDVKAPQRGG